MSRREFVSLFLLLFFTNSLFLLCLVGCVSFGKIIIIKKAKKYQREKRREEREERKKAERRCRVLHLFAVQTLRRLKSSSQLHIQVTTVESNLMALQLKLSCDNDKKDIGPTLIHSTGVENYKIPPEVVSCWCNQCCWSKAFAFRATSWSHAFIDDD